MTERKTGLFCRYYIFSDKVICFELSSRNICCSCQTVGSEMINMKYFVFFLASLRNGTCHSHLQEKFAPLVVRYVDLMESSIAQSVYHGFEEETWAPVG